MLVVYASIAGYLFHKSINIKMRNFILLITVFLTLGNLSACNTVQGIGKDIEAAGGAIEGSAKKNKKY